MRRLKDAGRTVPGFPGWNDYAEGYAKATGACCAEHNTDPANTNQDLNYSSSIEFELQLGTNWITADTGLVLDDLLGARGQRDLSPIIWTEPRKGKK
jgi:hypothetical protein